MRIIFMGTPDFAAESFMALMDESHEVLCVFTQPDKPKGRRQELCCPPVKELALKRGVKVMQPSSLKDQDTVEYIRNLSPDVIVVAAYGKILPELILKIPRYGCINVHGSLLPKYRGAAPIQWSIIKGEDVTGITTMLMDNGLDTGDILLKDQISIYENETSGELYKKLSGIGARLIVKTLKELSAGRLKPLKQSNDEACYAPILNKELGRIDWKKPARDIHNLIRGLNPWPVAFTTLMGSRLKIYESQIWNKVSKRPGEILCIDPLIIGCANGESLKIIKVQAEGKKKMDAESFVRGIRLRDNIILGDD